MANITWDQTEYNASETRNYEPLPRGGYLCRVDKIEERPNSKKTGTLFAAEFTVIEDGPWTARKLWTTFNVHHESEDAQRIGREQFKALCVAAGKPDLKKTEMLIGKEVIVSVRVEQKENKEPTNRVDGFDRPEGTNQAPAASRSAAKATAGADDDIPF